MVDCSSQLSDSIASSRHGMPDRSRFWTADATLPSATSVWVGGISVPSRESEGTPCHGRPLHTKSNESVPAGICHRLRIYAIYDISNDSALLLSLWSGRWLRKLRLLVDSLLPSPPCTSVPFDLLF